MIERSNAEVYVEWQPVEDMGTDDVALDRLCFESSDLVLVLSVGPHGRLLRICFEAPVAFRNIGESYRIRTWNEARESLLGLHIVEGSRWVRWLLEESGGSLAQTHLTHFSIITPDDCVDVVTEFAPSVKWTDELPGHLLPNNVEGHA